MGKQFEGRPKGKIGGKLNVDTVINGIIANKNKVTIAKEAGSLATSTSALSQATTRVMKTPEFKKKMKTVRQKLTRIRDRQLDKLSEQSLEDVKHSDLVKAMDTVIKLAELLDNKPTERIDIGTSNLDAFLKNA